MSKKLTVGGYLILFFPNIFITILAAVLIGFLSAKLDRVVDIILNSNPIEDDPWAIIQKVRLNCFQLSIEYPLLPVELCESYALALKLGKVVVVLSTFYNAYLLNALYGSVIVPAIMMGVMSPFIFYLNFTNDTLPVHLSGIILVFMGFAIIIGQYLFPNSDEYLRKQWLKLKNWFLKNKNAYLHNTIGSKEDKHED